MSTAQPAFTPNHVPAWHQLPGESSEAYLAFSTYRDLGPGRSINRAYRLHTAGKRDTLAGPLQTGYNSSTKARRVSSGVERLET